LHRLEVLGHVEVDWAGGDWAVTPPVFAVLPGSGGNAVVVGARSPAARGLLADAATEGLVSFTVVRQGEGPEVWYVGADDRGRFAAAASCVGATVSWNVSRQYSKLLSPVRDVVQVARRPFTPGGVEASRFDERSLRFEPFTLRGRQLAPGMC
jgi:hypothetical protein